MTRWYTLRTNSTANFTVALQCCDEESPDSSWWDDETRDRMERGIYHSFCFRVVVLWNGREIGADYLGDSIYENPADFGKEHIGINGTGAGSYYSDMVRQAISEARKTLRNPPRVRRCDPAID